MSFLLLVRRTHLYLGLFLLPWVIMFGVSSIPLNYPGNNGQAVWSPFLDAPFSVEPPASSAPEGLRPLGEQMMKAAGLSGGYYVNRANPKQINVNHPNFTHPVRMMYYIDQKRVVAERREFAFRQSLPAMHTRGGYNLGGFWDWMWALVVDLVSVSLLVWIASGLFMWWKLPGTGLRRWGWLALAGGLISFGMIIAKL